MMRTCAIFGVRNPDKHVWLTPLVRVEAFACDEGETRLPRAVVDTIDANMLCAARFSVEKLALRLRLWA
jgi:hypothetical protein